MLRRNNRKRQRPDATDAAAAVAHSSADTNANREASVSVSAFVGSEEDTTDLADLFNDTLSTVDLLMERNRAGFARIGLPPVVLRHQITVYTITAILNRLRQDGTLVCFRVPTGANEVAVVRQRDYSALLRQRKAELGIVFDGSSATRNELQVTALAMLRTALTEIAKLPIITAGALLLIFQSQEPESKDTENHERIGHLQRMGFLITTTHLDEQGYYLSMPGIGQVVTAVKKTRTSLTQALQRTKYKEAFHHQLKKLKLKHSKLDLEYHLADMEGCDLIRRVSATSGVLVSLVRK